jgi:hypothetical protein
VILLGLLLVLPSTALYAQQSSQGAQYYVFLGSDKELQMNVQVWGQVLKPGMYSVPQTTDLVALISYAGGPTQYANLNGIRIVRSSPKPRVLNVSLRNYMNTGNLKFQPVMKPGDTVVVPGSLFYGISRLVRVVSQLAIVANVYYLFFVK